jgi:hypothetical protein
MPPFTFEVIFLDTSEKQRFDDILRYEDTETHHVLHSESKGMMEFYKDATKVAQISFTPFVIDANQNDD